MATEVKTSEFNCQELKISLDDISLGCAPVITNVKKTSSERRGRNLSDSSGGGSDTSNGGSLDSGLGTPLITTPIISTGKETESDSADNSPTFETVIEEETETIDDDNIVYQFIIPNNLGGSMVGTKGSHIRKVRNASGAQCWISRNRFDKSSQIVNLKGTPDEITLGLKTIRKRFPKLNIRPINTSVPLHLNPTLQPELYELSLPINCKVDVLVTKVHEQIRLFVQQPTHGSFHGLDALHDCIQKFYSKKNVPGLPRPVNPGAVVIAPSSKSGKYYRAVIGDVFPEEDTALIRHVDFGGYDRIPVAQLRQIRTEVMHLPFQCTEVHLAYVQPNPSNLDSEDFSDWLYSTFLQGKRLQASVAYLNFNGQPCVNVYFMDGPHQGSTVQEILVQNNLLEFMSWEQTCCIQPFETMPTYYQNFVLRKQDV